MIVKALCCLCLFIFVYLCMKTNKKSNPFLGFFPDKRIAKRILLTLNLMIDKGTYNVNKMADNHAEKIAVYRMLNNDRFSYKEILEASFEKCATNIDANHVLVFKIQQSLIIKE